METPLPSAEMPGHGLLTVIVGPIFAGKTMHLAAYGAHRIGIEQKKTCIYQDIKNS